MLRDRPRIVKAGWDVPSYFKCKKPEFTEYLNASAPYDQRKRMGQIYWAMERNKITGYMVLAMGNVDQEKQPDLDIDSYGPVPALLIARLATDERYEGQGVGRLMTSYAVRVARAMASRVGCRAVLANSEPDVVGFYEKVGFVKFKIVSNPSPAGIGGALHDDPGVKNSVDDDGYVPIYFDIGLKPFRPVRR